MIRHKLGRAVQWTEGDAHMVGRIVCVGDVPVSTFRNSANDRMILVALGHTRELVSIEEHRLSSYPSESIEEPTK